MTYAPDTKQLGGQLAVGVGFGYGKNTTQADVSVSPRGTELRAANYPRSTYTLAYNREHDQLRGTYFQPVQQQSVSVFFVRMK